VGAPKCLTLIIGVESFCLRHAVVNPEGGGRERNMTAKTGAFPEVGSVMAAGSNTPVLVEPEWNA
jgi:hypothetical protein